MVPLELCGPEGNVQCKDKFDVAGVAYPVVSLGKMIETGFAFSFDDYKCYMHKRKQACGDLSQRQDICAMDKAQVVEEHGSNDRAHRRGRDAWSCRRWAWRRTERPQTMEQEQ